MTIHRVGGTQLGPDPVESFALRSQTQYGLAGQRTVTLTTVAAVKLPTTVE
jgi:hypothetical protein